MFKSISMSWKFAKMSYQLVKENPKLLFFPLVSWAAMAVILVGLVWGALPFFSTEMLAEAADDKQGQIVTGAIGILIYFVGTFVFIFFNAALILCCAEVLEGRECRLRSGLEGAMERLPQIFIWALISTSVGLLIQMLERQRFIGKLVAGVLGTSWTILSFLVLPFLVLERASAIESISSSSTTITKHWGKVFIGNFSLMALGFILFVPFLAAAGLFVFFGFQTNEALGFAAVAVSVLVGIALMAGFSAANEMFRTILYRFAANRPLPAQIDTQSLEMAFRPKN
jgi:hypothetical protein